jgi:hypothetical protein
VEGGSRHRLAEPVAASARGHARRHPYPLQQGAPVDDRSDAGTQRTGGKVQRKSRRCRHLKMRSDRAGSRQDQRETIRCNHFESEAGSVKPTVEGVEQ